MSSSSSIKPLTLALALLFLSRKVHAVAPTFEGGGATDADFLSLLSTFDVVNGERERERKRVGLGRYVPTVRPFRPTPAWMPKLYVP